MSQPVAYNQIHDHSLYADSNPNAPFNGGHLDDELEAIERSIDGTLASLAQIQRDDGALANSSVHPDSLSAATLALIASDWIPRGLWATATIYQPGDVVEIGGGSYVCVILHLSGVFTTDQSAGKWVILSRPSDGVSVLTFIPPELHAAIKAGTDTTDLSGYIQAGIATGRSIDFVGGTFHCNNLTQSTELQSLYSSSGIARIIKNANGPLLTCSGEHVQCRNISFRGDAASPSFTGDGVVATGHHFSLINCGSRWMAGRAVKATGGHCEIYGTCDIYQTTDVSASGYDIELGVSGTASLYHQIFGVYTSQPTGGILMTDVGGVSIQGGEFGKLTIAAGTLPAGVNGGSTVGARILGDVSVGISSAMFSANLFGAITLTFEAGVAECSVDISNIFANGATIVNNGNANNLYIRRGLANGSVRYPRLQVGNVNGIRFEATDASDGANIQLTSANNLGITNTVANKGLQLTQAGASGVIQAFIDGNLRFFVDDNGAHVKVVATGSLPSAGAGNDGLVLIEDAGAGDRNLIIYAGAQRFRIDGGAAF